MNRMFILSIEIDDSWHDLTDEKICEMLKEKEEGHGIKVTNISRIDLQEKVWPCWTLSEDDIREIAEENNLSLEGLDLDEIADKFKEGIAWALEGWDNLLREAIEATRKETWIDTNGK